MPGAAEWQSIASTSDPEELRERILTGYKDGKPFTPYVPTVPLPTPLDWVLSARSNLDTLVFQVDLWSARGTMPRDLSEVGVRMKEIQYSSRTRAATDEFRRMQKLRAAIRGVDGAEVEALVVVGTNLASGAVAAEAERWLEKPVLAINPVTYWDALRRMGVTDRVHGHGRVLEEH